MAEWTCKRVVKGGHLGLYCVVFGVVIVGRGGGRGGRYPGMFTLFFRYFSVGKRVSVLSTCHSKISPPNRTGIGG